MSYQAKTIENNDSVEQFIQTIEDEQKRNDCWELIQIIQTICRYEPKMWGTSIIGFGIYHYKYESGHEGDAPLLGFSPRKNGLSIYLSCGAEISNELFSQLGKHKMAKACLSIRRLSDVNLDILKKILRNSWDYMRNKYS